MVNLINNVNIYIYFYHTKIIVITINIIKYFELKNIGKGDIAEE